VCVLYNKNIHPLTGYIFDFFRLEKIALMLLQLKHHMMFVEVKILFGFYETDNSKTKQKKTSNFTRKKKCTHVHSRERKVVFLVVARLIQCFPSYVPAPL